MLPFESVEDRRRIELVLSEEDVFLYHRGIEQIATDPARRFQLYKKSNGRDLVPLKIELEISRIS